MKLYQALTQITIDTKMIDTATNFKLVMEADHKPHYPAKQLYAYIESVLRPGSRHDQNNLAFVTDAAFIAENYDFTVFAADMHAFNLEDKLGVARNIVADLNRHVSVNIDTKRHEVQMLFVN